MDLIDQLKSRVLQLEQELFFKQNEVLKYKTQLGSINQKLEKLIAQLSQDQKAFLKIQRSLNPTELPKLQGVAISSKFIPGQQFGGDYFDIFELEDKFHFGVILSSCSGYSVSALLLSVLMKISAQIEANKGLAPHLVLKKIFDEIKGSLRPGDEANVLYCLFDRRHFKMSYAQIGRVLVYLQNKNRLTNLARNSTDVPTESQIIDLQPSDRLIFGTTELFEVKNLEGDPLGQEKLESVLKSISKPGPHEVRNEVFFAVEQHSKTTDAVRDMTLLVTEVQDRVIKLT
jgi:sigma-B regulation protein RsbU (phosphoserine phosphatase)